MKIVHCRSPRCGEPMFWTTSQNGKRMPLDAEPSAEGHFRVEGEGEPYPDAIYVAPYERDRWGGQLYIAHWSTCKDSESFRRKA